MKRITRRNFLHASAIAGLAFPMRRVVIGAERREGGLGANDQVQVAVVGLGATTAIGGVGGRGHQLIPRLREVPGVKIAALCDVDQTFLDREVRPFKDRNEQVTTYRDLRRLLEAKDIDAVVLALPNHWHALATVWACQAGKDVYVEKPFAHNLWEGQQMVAAARKYDRIVQVGTQNRSSTFLCQTFESLRKGGELGPIRFARALVYRPRDGIGTVSEPTPVPTTIDYELWCGPASKGPLRRKQLHYEWHWFWDTGNGEMGNNGVHMLDLCRWALGQQQAPARVISIGGRFGFNDCGETANTHMALFDYQPAPIICEIRNLRVGNDPKGIGAFRNQSRGLMVDCEGGYFAGDASGGALFEKNGKKIKDLPDDGSSKRLETTHLVNFIAAVRSRKAKDLAAEAREGHVSTACCHLANISYRLGKVTAPEGIREAVAKPPELMDAFNRCDEYLQANGVDLEKTRAVLGPWLSFDARRERFVGKLADEANALARREYRKRFEVPKIT